ncbi:GNAT family N-acetyltransferase [Streptomyces alfalfae]
MSGLTVSSAESADVTCIAELVAEIEQYSYLKELFVRDVHRRHGVASALMAQLHAVAAQLRCCRIEWTADRDNPEALKFYEAFGATPQDTKVFYRQTVRPRQTFQPDVAFRPAFDKRR